MIAQLAKAQPVADSRCAPTRLGGAPHAATLGAPRREVKRGGTHLDAVGVGEHERRLEEAVTSERGALELEREPVHSPSTHARRHDGDVEREPRTRRKQRSGRRDVRFELRGGDGAHGDDLSVDGALVS